MDGSIGTRPYTGSGRLILAALAMIAVGVLLLYFGSQASNTAKNESTTTADVYRSYNSTTDSSGITHERLVCSYSFTVDGKFYMGSGCPADDSNVSMKDDFKERLGDRQLIHATVYYNPTDPSTNSLTEFSSSSKLDTLGGRMLLSMGILLLVACLLWPLLMNKPGSGEPAREAAPAQQTVVPDVSNISEQQFLADLDKSLRSGEPSDHSSTE